MARLGYFLAEGLRSGQNGPFFLCRRSLLAVGGVWVALEVGLLFGGRIALWPEWVVFPVWAALFGHFHG